MTTKEQQIYSAIGALARLHKIDSKFRDYLKSVDTNINNLGSLMASDTEIFATCLDVELKVIGRPVTVDGNPVAFEYVFGEDHEGALTSYWRLYLDSTGKLLRMPNVKRDFGISTIRTLLNTFWSSLVSRSCVPHASHLRHNG